MPVQRSIAFTCIKQYVKELQFRFIGPVYNSPLKNLSNCLTTAILENFAEQNVHTLTHFLSFEKVTLEKKFSRLTCK